jgi:hypothetical protein
MGCSKINNFEHKGEFSPVYGTYPQFFPSYPPFLFAAARCISKYACCNQADDQKKKRKQRRLCLFLPTSADSNPIEQYRPTDDYLVKAVLRTTSVFSIDKGHNKDYYYLI